MIKKYFILFHWRPWHNSYIFLSRIFGKKDEPNLVKLVYESQFMFLNLRSSFYILVEIFYESLYESWKNHWQTLFMHKYCFPRIDSKIWFTSRYRMNMKWTGISLAQNLKEYITHRFIELQGKFKQVSQHGIGAKIRWIYVFDQCVQS